MALLNDDTASQDNDTLATTKASLDKIKQQLTTSGRFLLQGFLLKRSETLRKWNQRWFTLDPTTGKMEYRIERGDVNPKGSIVFDSGSSILLSPINFQGLPKYDGCCIYIQTMSKKEYFLCAETRGAARAWVSTLQAAQLVLRAHKEAVSSLGGTGSSKLGTVAAVVAAANATAREAAKEITVSMQSSGKQDISHGNDAPMDDLSIMKETLKVKDEELHQMAKEMRARDATIKELAERLSETAQAAEAAASAAHIMDNERKVARTEIAKLRGELDEKVRQSSQNIQAMLDRLKAAEKARDDALREAQVYRAELAKAREHAVVMEAARLRAEETARKAAIHVKNSTELAGVERGDTSEPIMKFEAEIVTKCPDMEDVDSPVEIQGAVQHQISQESAVDNETKPVESTVNYGTPYENVGLQNDTKLDTSQDPQ